MLHSVALGGEAGRRPDEGVVLREPADIELKLKFIGRRSASDPKDLPATSPESERYLVNQG